MHVCPLKKTITNQAPEYNKNKVIPRPAARGIGRSMHVCPNLKDWVEESVEVGFILLTLKFVD